MIAFIYVHPKNSNHLRSHLRAIMIMALAHNRLGLENKSARIFCVRQVYKILPTSLGTFKPTFYTFYTSHLRWNPVFIIQTSDRTQYFTILQYNLHSRKIQDNRSTRALTGTVKKISKITYIYGYPVLTFDKPQSRMFKSRLKEL